MTSPADAAPRAEGDAGLRSWMHTLGEIWTALPGLLNDRIELLSLELQRAGSALAQVVLLIVVGGILGVTAWLLLWAVIVGALVDAGWHSALALSAAMGVNLAAAAWAGLRARRLLPLLRLPATRRHLMISPAPPPTDENPDAARPATS